VTVAGKDTLEDYEFALPERLIAHYPMAAREQARLLILKCQPETIELGRIPDLVARCGAGDLIVRNTTRVFPARLRGRRMDTGGRIEALLVAALTSDTWKALVRPARRIREGTVLEFAGKLIAEVVASGEGGERSIRFQCGGVELDALVDSIGEVPLPPYIRRPVEESDRERYQTIYAQTRGSVAAPTAGLHLTSTIFADLRARGVRIADLLLHVGPGTFRPVGDAGIERHEMHPEEYLLPVETARAIEHTRRLGGRVIAVGTTVARVLETCAVGGGHVAPGAGTTRIFIRPPQRLQVVDGLLTNFHLPRSTLLMLVSALAGRERVLRAYETAIKAGFRFFSYGDAMFILP
jgi:S-adenosylmethionine:tRNA ribosyltransferase-isomerase